MLYVKRLTTTARLPNRVKNSDSGLDFYADEQVIIPEWGRATIRTGLALAIDPGKVGIFWPLRHSETVGLRTPVPTVIDSNDHDEVFIVLLNHSPHRYTVHVGDKIAQMLLQPVCPDLVIEMDELNP